MRRLIVLALLCSASLLAQANQPIVVAWGGVGFLSTNVDSKVASPYLAAALGDPGVASSLELRLQEGARRVLGGREDLLLEASKMVEQQDDSYVLSFVLAAENLEIQVVDGLHLVNFEIQALVLVVNISKDPARQRIVTNYPVRVRYTTIVPREPTEAERADVFYKLLVDPDPAMPDLVEEWLAQAGRMKFREANAWIRIAPTVFADSARGVLSGQGGDGASAQFVDQVGVRSSSILEAEFSRLLQLPTIPLGRSDATEKMLLSFANRSVAYSFNPPEPDYTIATLVDELRMVTASGATQTGATATGHAYAGRFRLRIHEGAGLQDDISPLIDVALKKVETVTFQDRELDPVQQLGRMVVNFSAEVAAGIASADRAWLDQARSALEDKDTRTISRQLKAWVQRVR